MIPLLIADIAEAMLLDKLTEEMLNDDTPSSAVQSAHCNPLTNSVEVTFHKGGTYSFPCSLERLARIQERRHQRRRSQRPDGQLMPRRPPPEKSYIDFGADGLPVEEIAALEGCTPSNIRNIIARAFRKLRAECARRGIKPEDILGHPMGE